MKINLKKLFSETPYINYKEEVETIKQSYNNTFRSLEHNLNHLESTTNEIRKKCNCEEDEPCYCFDDMENMKLHIWRAFEEECKSLIDRLLAQFIKYLKDFTSIETLTGYKRFRESEIGALMRYITTKMGIDLTSHSETINFLDKELRPIRVENQHNPQYYSKEELDNLHEKILDGFEKSVIFLKFLCDMKYEQSQNVRSNRL